MRYFTLLGEYIMKPLYAKCFGKDYSQSSKTGMSFYIIKFKVKFDDGHLEHLIFNTDSNYEKILSAEKITNELHTFFKSWTPLPWQSALFDCCIKLNEEAKWLTNTVSTDELNDLFSNPKQKFSCVML